MFASGLIMFLPLQARVEKTECRMETHWLLGKGKFLGTAFSKKLMVTVFWDMKGPITVDFLEKGATVNSTTNCQLIDKTHGNYSMFVIAVANWTLKKWH